MIREIDDNVLNSWIDKVRLARSQAVEANFHAHNPCEVIHDIERLNKTLLQLLDGLMIREAI